MFYCIPEHKPLTAYFRLIIHPGFSIALSVGLSMGFSLAAHADVHVDDHTATYGFARPASDNDIAKINIDVIPDGRGAPPGQGNFSQGKKVYADTCGVCHGADMEKPVKGTGAPALRGGRGSLTSNQPNKTVESYWPYASTLFDYVKRAMPFNNPGSLSDNQVYAVVAYILTEGNIIDRRSVMNAKTLAKVKMPNRNGFIADPRPEVFNTQ